MSGTWAFYGARNVLSGLVRLQLRLFLQSQSSESVPEPGPYLRKYIPLLYLQSAKRNLAEKEKSLKNRKFC